MAHRSRARARQSAGVEKRHAAGARTRSRCITVQPPATPRALTAVRLWLCAPSCKALDVSVSEGRPGEGRAVASGIMAEAGAMVPTSETASLPAGRRCQWCSCSRCRCMSACARQHCCRPPKRARTMRAWAARLLHSTGSRGCRNHLAGSPPCRAEPGERQQAAKKFVSTFSEQNLPSTFRVSRKGLI